MFDFGESRLETAISEYNKKVNSGLKRESNLYMLYNLEASPCWYLMTARSSEAALVHYLEHSNKPIPFYVVECSRRVEDVHPRGYHISIEYV